MNLRRLILALTFIAIFAMSARISMDTDSWWHLRTGHTISATRSIPKTDTFSFTRYGETWRYPSAAWLSQWAMFQLHRLAGPAALNLAVAALVTTAFAFLYPTLTGGPFLRALVLILTAATAAVYWAARPHILTFLFFALFLWRLEGYRWGRASHLYLLPPAMLLWANSHPGFAAGFILLAIYALDETISAISRAWPLDLSKIAPALRNSRLPHYALIAFLMLIAASINPSGPAMLAYPFETLSIGVLRDFIQEWQSPDFHNLAMQPFLWTLLLLIAALGFSKKSIAASELLLIGVFAYMAFLAGRNIALFALAAAPALSRHAEGPLSALAARLGLRLQTRAAPNRAQSLLNLNLLLVFLLLAAFKISQVLPAEANMRAFNAVLPQKAVALLREQGPPGRLFNSYNWGGYLIWALPEKPVFVDGRTDLYDDDLLTAWLSIVAAEPGWESKLAHWEIDLVLLEPHWPLLPLLQEKGWALLLEDEISVLYARP